MDVNNYSAAPSYVLEDKLFFNPLNHLSANLHVDVPRQPVSKLPGTMHGRL